MRVLAFCLAFFVSSYSWAAPEEPLEYKLAVIDAGRYIDHSDTSVARAANLVKAVAVKYHVPAEKAGDMATAASNELKKQQHQAVR